MQYVRSVWLEKFTSVGEAVRPDFRETEIYQTVENFFSVPNGSYLIDDSEIENVLSKQRGELSSFPPEGAFLVWTNDTDSDQGDRIGVVVSQSRDDASVRVMWGFALDDVRELTEENFIIHEVASDDYRDLNRPGEGYALALTVFPMGVRFTNPAVVNYICSFPERSNLSGAYNENDNGSYPLISDGFTKRDPYASKEEKVKQIGKIISELDLVNSVRFRKTSSGTTCNIYAHDFCYLTGVYFPRIWWALEGETYQTIDTKITSESRQRTIQSTLESGYFYRNVDFRSVVGFRANHLYDWLVKRSPLFGWETVYAGEQGSLNRDQLNSHFEALQDAANQGKIVVVAVKNRNTDGSGHIGMIAPETDQLKARRVPPPPPPTQDSETRQPANYRFHPLFTMSGYSENKKLYFAEAHWVWDEKYSHFGFFVHD